MVNGRRTYKSNKTRRQVYGQLHEALEVGDAILASHIATDAQGGRSMAMFSMQRIVRKCPTGQLRFFEGVLPNDTDSRKPELHSDIAHPIPAEWE